MNYRFNIFAFFVVLFLSSCKGDKTVNENPKEIEETFTTGYTTIYVDNSIMPIVEDELAVFQSRYQRTEIKQVNKPQDDVIAALLSDSTEVAVMSRKLTEKEEQYFRDKNVEPEVTAFAVDAIAFITNQTSNDSIIELEEVYKVLKGDNSANIKSLVFDNAKSSILEHLLDKAGVKEVPQEKVYAFKTNEEVLKYINDNKGAIGVIGVNWLVQPPVKVKPYIDSVKVLAVNNTNAKKDAEKGYFKPSQSNIAAGLYPLTRTLYVLNYQGKDGLGTGFAIYASAEDGQRIVLKSGLVPVTTPTRDIEIRNEW
ncbi:phosphate ABC transporter substrate-binding protein [Flavobacterium suaedae]|uniref:Phosphate ABC transporter substrate-binding protein n=1 Tax=Flavobacterium suaedae TaxID=1767027 RepID=A0ABQ1JZL2_9FLAO|nr:substrate-binding domain-containing protein [Flavobacterium suaedae]GGB83359.1 phosphate ABC transporter substrate-binding protein [Flavobacterium suaedae]